MSRTLLTTAEPPLARHPGARGPIYVLRDRVGRRLGTILAPCVELVFGRNAPTFLLKRRPFVNRAPRDTEPTDRA